MSDKLHVYPGAFVQLAVFRARRLARLRARDGGAGQRFSNSQNHLRHLGPMDRRIAEPRNFDRVYSGSDFSTDRKPETPAQPILGDPTFLPNPNHGAAQVAEPWAQ